MRTLLLAVLFANGWMTAQPAPGPQFDQRIQSTFRQSGAPSVSVAVVEDDKLVYAKAFGKADLETGRDADVSTRYAIGSISKQFTAAALLLLQEQGKISLDDKVARFFPELTRAREISIRQLLTHTAGYEDYAPQDYIIPEWTRPTSALAVVEKWARKPLNFDPGTRWQYSNTGYVLAALIFEKASGVKLGDFLSQKIFQPLGMTSASDCEAATPADATPYSRYALGPPRKVEREAAGWYTGAGQLCMTPSDLAKWNIAFLERKILSAKSYEEFTKEMKLADGKPTRYALGLQTGEMNGVAYVAHSGEVSGFLASNRVFPGKRASVVVLSNSDNLGVTGVLTAQISQLILGPSAALAPSSELEQVRSILTGLQQGRISRELFTSNANSYFSDVALGDFRSSLGPLGSLNHLVRTSESLRGGMTHRSYRADFEKGVMSLNIYVMPDGKYEQFLVSAAGQ